MCVAPIGLAGLREAGRGWEVEPSAPPPQQERIGSFGLPGARVFVHLRQVLGGFRKRQGEWTVRR